jgi:chromosome segregation ATPase
MPSYVARRTRPEDEELLRKREELAALQATLAERELELADLRCQLAAFEGRYLRQVGTLYAELDEWKARVSELQARLHPSAVAEERAQEAREQARQTYADAHGKASEIGDFAPPPELKSLYREVAKRIHPDLSRGVEDMERRTKLMAEANLAYQAGDVEALQRILNQYEAEEFEGEGIGAELVRIIRQISLVKDRISEIERELTALRQSETALLKKQAEEAEQDGRDLLGELATAVREQIGRMKLEFETLAQQDRPT